MDAKERSLLEEFGKAGSGWANGGGSLIPESFKEELVEKLSKAYSVPRHMLAGTTVVTTDWEYGTVIRHDVGGSWSKAMYLGRDKHGKHFATILSTSFGPGLGVDPGDPLNIDPKEWRKVDE